MKKEEDDILIKGIRKRLNNYSVEIPDELWSSLEKDLNRIHASSSFSFRKMVVAAAVLIAVITSVSLWMLNMPIDKYIPEIALVSDSIPEDINQTEIAQKQELPMSQPLKRLAKTVLAKAGKSENKITEQIEIEDKAIVAEVTSTLEETAETESGEQTSMQTDNQKKEDKREKKRLYPTRDRNSYGSMTSLNKKDYKKWAISVAYANTPSIKNNAIPGFSTLDRSCNVFQSTVLPTNDLEMSQEGANKVKPIRKVLLNNMGKDAKTNIEHKMPVTAGLSFRYKLSKNFAVETGLTYTMLSSELKAGSANDFYVEEYKLHYLGIPIKGNWMFLNTKYLTLYLSAGGEFEKSMAGKYKKTYVTSDEPELSWNENVKPIQWSVLGSVGIQLNATENFGVYVEPGVVHYFNDGSEVQTIRKERPTNFNLQLGLRWTY